MKFISKKYTQLAIVLDPKAYRPIEGRRVTVGLNNYFPTGRRVQFQNGIYETQDPKEIELLKANKGYGVAYFTPDEEATLNPEAVRDEEEKKALAEEVGSTCPECGAKFKTATALNGHMRIHKKE